MSGGKVTLNWYKEDYLPKLLSKKLKHRYELDSSEDSSDSSFSLFEDFRQALRNLVGDLQTGRAATIRFFIEHTGGEDFLYAILSLIASDNDKVAGNAAFVMGTVADSQAGLERLTTIVVQEKYGTNTILYDLLTLMDRKDDEITLNAVGAIGSIADSGDGRVWLLKHELFAQLISSLVAHFNHRNQWIASNSTLVIARLSIDEAGVRALLGHRECAQMLLNLLSLLVLDEAGKGMNAAFAIGRICDLADGIEAVVEHCSIEIVCQKLTALALTGDDGALKNACFALSCLSLSDKTHKFVLTCSSFEHLCHALCHTFTSSRDDEMRWFAAMALKTFAAKPFGNKRVRNMGFVYRTATQLSKEFLPNDIADEVAALIASLQPFAKPEPPTPQLTSPNQITISWSPPQVNRDVFVDLRYSLLHVERNIIVYEGAETSFLHKTLSPFSPHSYQLKIVSQAETSSSSLPSIVVMTEEDSPSPPIDVRVLTVTHNQLRIVWQPPEKPNGIVRGFVATLSGCSGTGDDKHETKRTNELSVIFSSLHYNTRYSIGVCALNGKGNSEAAQLFAETADIESCLPGKPVIDVRGRHEVFADWTAPITPLGKISYYELYADNDVVYKGVQLCSSINRLQANTEYAFMVRLFTNEGRFDSKITRAKTSVDVFRGRLGSLDSKPATQHRKERRELTTNNNNNSNIRKTTSRVKPRYLDSLKRSNTMPNVSSTISATRPSIDLELPSRQQRIKTPSLPRQKTGDKEAFQPTKCGVDSSGATPEPALTHAFPQRSSRPPTSFVGTRATVKDNTVKAWLRQNFQPQRHLPRTLRKKTDRLVMSTT